MKTNRLVYEYCINNLNKFKKMKSITVLLNFVQYLYHRIQCDKTHNVVHGKAFEVQHETVPILGMELKRHTESITYVQFASNFLSMSPKLCFWQKCKCCELLYQKCWLTGCFKSITVIWNILRLFLSMNKMVQRVWLYKMMPLRYKMC